MRVLLDAMVLAAGLTSRREPASFSRRIVEAAVDGLVELVVTETLIDETSAVLLDPDYVGHLDVEVAGDLLTGLQALAVEVVRDRGTAPPRRCADPGDDYLVEAALVHGAVLVTRDDAAGCSSVSGLDSGRPGTALRRAGLLG